MPLKAMLRAPWIRFLAMDFYGNDYANRKSAVLVNLTLVTREKLRDFGCTP